jgi:hypothetical protein
LGFLVPGVVMTPVGAFSSPAVTLGPFFARAPMSEDGEIQLHVTYACHLDMDKAFCACMRISIAVLTRFDLSQNAQPNERFFKTAKPSVVRSQRLCLVPHTCRATPVDTRQSLGCRNRAVKFGSSLSSPLRGKGTPQSDPRRIAPVRVRSSVFTISMCGSCRDELASCALHRLAVLMPQRILLFGSIARPTPHKLDVIPGPWPEAPFARIPGPVVGILSSPSWRASTNKHYAPSLFREPSAR